MNDQQLLCPDLGVMLDQLRERLRWSQRQLSAELDEHESNISRVLSRRAGVRVQLRIVRKVTTRLETRLLPEEAKSFRQYQAWCEQRADGMTSESWEQYWQGLQETSEPSSTSSKIPATVPLLRPPRVQHFTGREHEIEHILRDLQPGRVVTLCGPGGVGKSAIASEVVWRLTPGDEPAVLFPDGLIYHDFYKEPHAAIALENIARSFGEEPRPTPAAAAQRSLSRKKALLVLEGVENADDLDAVLVVRGSCGALLTSRSRGDVIDLRHDIVPLPIEEAVELLKAWGGARVANTEIAKQICSLIGGLPLAVRLAGSYMAEREEEATEYLEWLQDMPLAALDHGSHQHDSIPALLHRSLAQVSDVAQKATAIAGLLALAPFTHEAIAAALEVRAGDSTRALGELVRYSLLERPERRFRVSHALVHTFASRHLTAPERAVVHLATYYNDLAQQLSALGRAGYAQLDSERAHIMAVLSKCVEKQHWEKAQSLASIIDAYLDRQGHWFERVISNEIGLKAAQATKDRQAEGAWLSNLGAIYRRMGDAQRAIPLFELALAIFRETGNRQGEGESLRRLAGAYRFLGNDADAVIELHEQSLAIARATANQREEANNLNDLGIVYADLGKKRQAITLYEQALTIFRAVNDREGEGKVLGNLGVAYGNLGEIQHSILLYEQSQEIVREIGDRKGESYNLNDLGNAYAKLGKVQQAILFFEQYLAIVRELGDREGEGLAFLNLGEAYTKAGDALRAVEYHEKSLAIVRSIGDFSREVGNLSGMSKAYLALGATQHAITYGKQALVIARKIKERDEEARALATLASAYLFIGEEQQSIVYFKQAIMTARETGNRYTETRWAWELGLLYEELGDYEQAASLMSITVEYELQIGHTEATAHAQHLRAIHHKVL